MSAYLYICVYVFVCVVVCVSRVTQFLFRISLCRVERLEGKHRAEDWATHGPGHLCSL